jgi:MoxR-like ATPase
MFLTVDELDRLGTLIENVLLGMVQAAGPLFRYCYDVRQGGERVADTLQEGFLPEQQDSIAERVQALDIVPSAEFDAEALQELAKTEHGLELEPGVYRAVVAAIRSGKHVILTGPPGTAKTTLAEVVCQLAGDARWCSGHALTTATSDWTTYETIGGLRPAGSGTSLEFRAGILLEAVRDNRWVIIDELNRSNFDRAFGQFFTVLSGQPVVLPYEDPQTGRRILLCPQKAARRNQAEGYERVLIPEKWRIVATMNVFDKSLLYEMSFALMRRFAFIEVPSPEPPVFELLWNRELEDLQPEQADRIRHTLTGLMALRSVKDIGPAVFIDMARFAAEYLSAGEDLTAGQLAFQLFYSYLLPQYEGTTQQQGLDLFNKFHAITGPTSTERLARTLTEVLGIALLSEPADDGDDGLYPSTAPASVSLP